MYVWRATKILGSFLPHVPVPTPFIVAMLMVLLTALLLRKTALGLYIQSVGINAKASRLVGIKSTMIVFLAYAFCGICSGLAGLIASSRIYSADANNIGLNMELDAILAVAIGGNSLGGGKFSLAGSVIGAYTIQALTTTLYAMHGIFGSGSGVQGNRRCHYRGTSVTGLCEMA